MPPLPDVPSVLKVRFIGDFDGSEWANIMHVKYDGTPPSDAQCAALALSWGGLFDSTFFDHMSNTTHLTFVDVTDLTSSTSGYGSDATAYTADAAGNILAADSAAMVDWEIRTRYRGGHPRTYLSGQLQGFLTDARTFTVGHQTDVTGDALAFKAGIAATVQAPTSPFTLGCVHYFVPGGSKTKPPTFRTPPVFDAFLSGGMGLRVKSQRRRTGRGA